MILDLTVRGGMGGKETLARLLAIDPAVQAIASSGYSDDPIVADPVSYGFAASVCKPYRKEEIGKAVARAQCKKGELKGAARERQGMKPLF